MSVKTEGKLLELRIYDSSCLNVNNFISNKCFNVFSLRMFSVSFILEGCWKNPFFFSDEMAIAEVYKQVFISAKTLTNTDTSWFLPLKNSIPGSIEASLGNMFST